MQAAPVEARRFQPLELPTARLARVVGRFKELDRKVQISDTLEELTGIRISVKSEAGDETLSYSSETGLLGQSRWRLWVDVDSPQKDIAIFVDEVDPESSNRSTRRRTVLTYTSHGELLIGSPMKTLVPTWPSRMLGQPTAKGAARSRIEHELFPQA